MPKRDDGETKIRGSINTCKSIFWTTAKTEYISKMDENNNNNKNNEEEKEKEIEPGLRSETWFDMMENLTKENKQRSIDNKILLTNVDQRTVWIARILVGIFVTVVGGILIEIII